MVAKTNDICVYYNCKLITTQETGTTNLRKINLRCAAEYAAWSKVRIPKTTQIL